VREVNANCAAPIMVTEHGINTLDDPQRVRHLKASIAGMDGCIAQGIPILGYIHFGLFDTWEWGSGYTPRFGLVAVDRQTFARSPKPSAAAYRRLIAEMRRARSWA